MNIVQFWRIFWAWRWFIVATTASCMAGAFVVANVLPPAWSAHARIVLNVLKTDPESGMVVSGGATSAYISAQLSLITDYSVASRVVDNLGWMSDPVLIARYNTRPASDTRDFRHWAADELVIKNTVPTILAKSNILDIEYKGRTADSVRVVADELRKAYIETNFDLRRRTGEQGAERLDAEVIKSGAALKAAETAMYQFQRENKVYMATDTMDMDTARLAAMVKPDTTTGPGGLSPRVELSQVESQIALLSKTLGPNHPELIALQGRRAALAAAVARELDINSKQGNNTLDAQAAIMLSKGDKLIRLKQLQREIEVRREIYNSTVQMVAKLRQEAAIADTSTFSPLGPATVPAAPTFPNMRLIVPGSFALGLLLGMLISLLIELLNRRVRGPEDMKAAVDVPLLAVISPVW